MFSHQVGTNWSLVLLFSSFVDQIIIYNPPCSTPLESTYSFLHWDTVHHIFPPRTSDSFLHLQSNPVTTICLDRRILEMWLEAIRRRLVIQVCVFKVPFAWSEMGCLFFYLLGFWWIELLIWISPYIIDRSEAAKQHSQQVLDEQFGGGEGIGGGQGAEARQEKNTGNVVGGYKAWVST